MRIKLFSPNNKVTPLIKNVGLSTYDLVSIRFKLPMSRHSQKQVIRIYDLELVSQILATILI